MKLKKIFSGLHDETKEPQDRMFVLVVIVAMAALVLITIVGVMLGESTEDLLILGLSFPVFGVFTMLAFKYDKVQFFAKLAGALLILVIMPMTFITSGGMNGGAPMWFIFVALFVSLIIIGKMRWVLLGILMLVICGCYYIQYYHPELMTPHTEEMAFKDSLISVLMITLLLCLLVRYEILILKEAYRRAEEQRKEIDELNKSQSKFFSSMSHEIRTPINTIIGLNEMILRENISDEVAEDANNVRSASKILLHLINDILDMSKFESGKMELTPGNYDIGKMISEIVGMFWMRTKEKGLEFHVDVDPDLPMELYGDEVRIEQILINVLNNAIKYTMEGSVKLSIQYRRLDEKRCQIIYSVTDTGIGIKKESIPYLFTAFKRIDENENKHIEGTGLGLSIVKQLVELMNGTISVNSVYTKGTTFIITIPQEIAGDEKVRIGKVDIEKNNEEKRHLAYHSRFEAPEARILAVDDNASNLLVLTKLLKATGMNIDTVQSGRQALEKTMVNEYDLIFLDHMMPEMNGIECFHAIKSQVGGVNRDTKVVILTANADSESKAMYVKEGFDGYLVKPTSGEKLEKECMRLLPKDMVHAVYTDDSIVEESMSWLKDHDRKEEVLISADSVADISADLIKKYNISIIRHKLITTEGIFTDGKEIESEGLISYMTKSGNIAQNMAPSVEDFESYFAKLLTKANNIIHISISGKVTDSAYSAAAEASKAFDNVTVIDSKHLSSGQALMVLEACQLVKEGLSVDEIRKRLESSWKNFSTSFVVRDLEYMEKAGQVDGGILSITRALMVRPVLTMKKGKITVGKLFFGSQENSWRKYIASELRFTQNIDKKLLFVTYVGMSQKDLDIVKEEIEKRATFERIIFQKASPVIALNCGPGTFGLLYKKKN
ncbi:MAG: DegV family EDD domain-containing protein [Lachnospiraceae bacterium]|nr:DegV family EDD domain-containing protein [Lachnospiraceae bacterium]